MAQTFKLFSNIVFKREKKKVSNCNCLKKTQSGYGKKDINKTQQILET